MVAGMAAFLGAPRGGMRGIGVGLTCLTGLT